jgi:hypothetical protein
MATVSDDLRTITIYQGETADLAFSVVDGAGSAYDLTDGAAKLTYKANGATAVDVAGTISTSTVTVSFTHATTQLMAGVYEFQLMCRNSSNQIVMVREGFIDVKESLNPDAVSV